ncbi:MAG: peroxiredoxin [Propylenella sp.]
MTLSVGDRAPEADLFIPGANGPEKVRSTDLFAGRNVVLVGMPGAFTPTCHRNHLPGFIENRDAILAKGVDEIMILTTNDTHVMKAWAEASGGKDKVTFVSDGNADFVQKAGLSNDSSARGMSIRSKRFAMILEDGVVKTLLLEDQPGQAVISSAARILEAL